MATKRRRFTAEFKARVAITGLHDLPRLQVVVPTRRSAKPVNTSLGATRVTRAHPLH